MISFIREMIITFVIFFVVIPSISDKVYYKNCCPMGSFFYLLRRVAAFGCIIVALRAKQWGPSGPAEMFENPF